MTSADYFSQQKQEIIKYYMMMNNENISFIGLDRSLVSTGFAVMRGGKYIEGRCFGSKNYGGHRLFDLAQAIMPYIRRYPNALVMTEDYNFHQQSGSRAITGLAELGGVLKMLWHHRQIKFLNVSSSTLKKYVIGNGTAKKTMMPLWVNKKFNIMPINDDHADAIGLMQLGYNAFKFERDKTLNYTIKDQECFKTLMSLDTKKIAKRREAKKRKQELRSVDG